jgi:hypothetical protein
MIEDAIIRWTARLAVACYVSRLCWDVAGCRDAASQKKARLVWSVGCAIFLLHVAAAFHFLYGWSHESAYEHVRKRTFDQTGWNSGFGIYINYAFTLLWLTDTILWWRRPDWPEQRLPYWITQGVFAFLMFQATAVFGPWFWTPLCAVIALFLLILSSNKHRIHDKAIPRTD